MKSGRLKWAWTTGIPLAWDATVTLTPRWQKVFSSDPRVGFFKQRSVYQDGIDRGEGLAPAKSMDDMHTIVTNSTVDGVLSAVLALLIVVVIADAARVCVRHIRRPALSSLSEVAYVESKIVAPAGLLPTREEKEEERRAVVGSAAPGSSGDQGSALVRTGVDRRVGVRAVCLAHTGGAPAGAGAHPAGVRADAYGPAGSGPPAGVPLLLTHTSHQQGLSVMRTGFHKAKPSPRFPARCTSDHRYR